MIAEEMAGPKEHLKFYDKFNDLISRKVIHFPFNTMTIVFIIYNSSIMLQIPIDSFVV